MSITTENQRKNITTTGNIIKKEKIPYKIKQFRNKETFILEPEIAVLIYNKRTWLINANSSCSRKTKMRKNHAWFLSRSNTCAISLTCTCTEITMELGGLSEFPFYTAAIFLRGGQFITVEGARWRGEHGCFCWARRALKFLICWQSWGQSVRSTSFPNSIPSSIA